MNIKLSHTRLLVKDFQESLNFYKRLLAREPVILTNTYADFPTGSGHVALYCRSEMAKTIATENRPDCDRSQQDVYMLIFSVPDVDVIYSELKGHCQVVRQPADRIGWGVRTAHFRDPDGNLIEINQDL